MFWQIGYSPKELPKLAQKTPFIPILGALHLTYLPFHCQNFFWMPSMAIVVIKYDGDGNPIRAKYRICALGNLDPHNWSKADYFAPVLSQLELRFLVSLAVHLNVFPKTGDITQAFCQSVLPESEKYILHPPVGCPISPPKTYWKLKKTLYRLKRSPRHFYD